MSFDLKPDANSEGVEPLLPVEKKLIGISFALGLVLLVLLVALNHYIPAKL